jgi:hypothetical protein
MEITAMSSRRGSYRHGSLVDHAVLLQCRYGGGFRTNGVQILKYSLLYLRA